MNPDFGNLTRRRMLVRGAFGTAGLMLGGHPLLGKSTAPAVAPAASAAPARAVIQIWMWGGPSHLDSFDPKPDAGRDYCGPYTSPIATRADGVRICEKLPLLAEQARHFSLIRSMTHGINAHETASYAVQTGHPPGRLLWPSLGALVSLFKGYDHGYKDLIPPYVVLTSPQGRFSECGFLGPAHKPFATGGDPNRERFEVEGIVSSRITDERQKQRRKLLGELDTFGRALPGDPALRHKEQCEEKAYELILGEARELFDLSTESPEVRDSYGRSTFGQSCLMARRLVERGVPYVTINYKGWDTHKQHFQTMDRNLPEMDAGLATLISDLESRGLLDSTIIWWGGEFGRTPKIQWEPPWNGGRGHFGACFSALLAGGGFRGGQVVGASDSTGSEVADRPVYPNELLGSILERMGIDPEGPLPNPLGEDLKVMPAGIDGFPRGDGRLREIM
ncbi:DUF1501 domain-containing protein [Haloferula sp. A504]|uniref:DUF1501 domain-containing protein n=1 Tax=Haloferula sp. A504 TaxID=3373601 RepID=UPI0031C5E07B|nr:DUF1501 domain-containing protein [Verrucomicrobiaceae bacterium E54]